MADERSLDQFALLRDIKGGGPWVPVFSGLANCSAITITRAEFTKLGKLTYLQLTVGLTVTVITTATGFTFTLPVDQAIAAEQSVGLARLTGGAGNGFGLVLDATGANKTEVAVTFQAAQVLAAGAQSCQLSLLYHCEP